MNQGVAPKHGLTEIAFSQSVLFLLSKKIQRKIFRFKIFLKADMQYGIISFERGENNA